MRVNLLLKKFDLTSIFLFSQKWFRGFYSLDKKVGTTCPIRQQNIERISKAIPW